MKLSTQARRKVLPIFLAGFFISACRKAPPPPPPPAPPAKPASARRAVPDFSLQDLEGRTVSLSQFRGRPVMLDFWATWCGPCQMSMPSLEKLHKEYAPKGLQVLGMNVDEDPSVVEGFVRAMRTTYPVLLVGSSGVDAQYGVSGIPAFLLIDQDGGAVRSWVGFGPEFESEWRSAVDALLAEG